MKNFTKDFSFINICSFFKTLFWGKLVVLLCLVVIEFSVFGQTPSRFTSGNYANPNNWAQGSSVAMGTINGTNIHTTTANGTGLQYFRFYSATSGGTIYEPNGGADIQLTSSTSSALQVTGSGKAYFLNIGSTSNNIVFKTSGSGAPGTSAIVCFELQGNINTVNSITQSPVAANVFPGQAVTVTANMSANQTAGQNVYLRYTTNGWFSSSVVPMTYSSSIATGTIPATANTASAPINYYVFTSGPNNVASDGSNADLFTITTSSNSNYTVQSGWATANNGTWSTPSTWTANAVPPTAASMGAVVIGHNVTLDQAALVSGITINTGFTLTGADASSRTLTIAAGGTFTNNSSTGSGYTATANSNIDFSGSGTINGSQATTFNNLTINSATLTLTTIPTINGNFQINNGNVNTAPNYGASSKLIYNVNYDRFSEWGTTGSTIPNIVEVNSPYALGMSKNVGNRSTRGALNIYGSVNWSDATNQANTLTVGGDVNISGTLALSSNAAGSLTVAGSWLRNGGGVFTPGTATTVTFTGTGKTISGSGGASFYNLTINGSISAASAITVTNTFAIGAGNSFSLNGNNASAVLLSAGSTTSTINNGHASTASALTFNNSVANTFSGTLINGSTAVLNITKTGAGNLTLSGLLNNYSGTTTISAGTLTATANASLPDNGNIIIGNATLALGASFTGAKTLGTLNLTGTTSYLNVASSGIFDLAFASSSGLGWSGTFNVLNWTPAASKNIYFLSTGLTGTQLDNFNFDNYGIGAKFEGATNKVIPKLLFITNCPGPVGGSFGIAANWQNNDVPTITLSSGQASIYIRPGDILNQDQTYNLLSVNVAGIYNVGAYTINITGSITSPPPAGFITNTGTINMVATSVFNLGDNCTFNNSGTIASAAGSQINFNTGGKLINSGTPNYTGAAGVINFLGTGTISGTATIPFTTIAGAVDFGTGSTIGTSLVLKTGGSVTGNAPKYGTSSTLFYYQTGLTVSRGLEWVAGTTSTSSAGYPNNVTVGNGTGATSLNINNGTVLQMGGSLLISTSSTLTMNDNVTPYNLKVIKDVTISGILNLGNFVAGPPYIGDLETGGNFTRNTGGTFNPNQRAVIFNGASNQTIDGSTNPITFAYFIVANSGSAGSNTVKLINATDALIDGGIGGHPLQLLNGNLDLNGRTMTLRTFTYNFLNDVKIDGSNGNLTRQILSTAGSATFNFTNPDNSQRTSTVTRNSAAASLLSFSSDILVNIFTGVGGGRSGVDFGADLGVGFTTINGSLLINSNTFVSVNAPNYDAASKLIYQTNGSYDRSAEWIRNTAGPGYPGNVIIQGATTLNFLVGPNTGCAGNLTIGNPTAAGNGVLNLKDYGAAYDLGVGGDLIIGGASATGSLIMSDNIGSDIFIGKGWNRNANGTVNFGAGDGRAVAFNGSADGIITANGGQQFPFVGINKTGISNKITLADNVSISDEIQFTTGTVDLGTNNTFLTILSTATKTGRVGQSDAVNTAFVYGAGVTGQFIVQRYMPAKRSWRLMAAPFKPGAGTHTISEAWQERGNAAVGLDYTAANFSTSITTDTITTIGSTSTTGFSTHITGGTTANGFDLSPTNNPGIKYYSGGSWLAPTNVNNTSVNSQEGWMLFVRGDRKGYGEITNQSKPATITTLRPRGQIFIGNKSIISLSGGLTVVGNPYASAVDYNSMSRTGGLWPTSPTYYMWDPNLGGATGQGAFVALTWNGTDFTRSVPVSGTGTSNIDNRYIPSGAAIMVEFPSGGGTLTFDESNKNVNNTTTAFRPVRNQLQTVLKTVDTDSSSYISDGALLLIDPAFSNKADRDDVVKINNFTENFGLFRNDKILSIERKNLTADYDTLFYNLAQMRLKKYQFQFIADQIVARPGTALFLEDLYLKSKTALPLNDTAVYNFTITTDTGSYARKRFRLLFNPSVVYNNFSTTDLGTMVAIDWKVAEEFNINRYEVERSLNAVNFSSINTQVSNGNSTTPVAYQILDKDLLPGNYYYRIKSISNIGVIKYSEIAKVTLMKSNPTIYIAPNPVTDNIIHLQMNTVPAGRYAVRLLNNAGQVMQTSTITHTGVNTLHTMALNQSIAKGTYQLELSAKGQKTMLLKVLIQ